MTTFTQGTVTDRRILEAIRDGWTQNGYGPSIREIANAVGFAAWSAASWRLELLVRAGLVANEPHVPRSARLTPAGIAELEGSFPLIPARIDVEAGVITLIRGDQS